MTERRTPLSTWSGYETARPAHRWKPRTAEQAAGVVARAAEEGSRVRVIGAGHSFMPVALTEDHQVSLDEMSGVVSVDAATQRVRLAAGTRLRDIPALLAPYGLALPNQGDVNPQSVAGALSTGTHGTGLAFTGFAGMVTGLTLLTADGRIRRLSRDEEPEVFDHARLSLGVLGILLEVELQCCDAFDLVAQETGEELDEVLDGFAERARTHDHVEFFWFPGTTRASVKTNTRVAPGAEAPGELAGIGRRHRVGQWLTEELVDNAAFAAVCALGHRVPAAVPLTNRISAAATSHRAYRAPAHEVFVSPRRVRFNESEYAVPLEAGPDAVRALRRTMDRKGWSISFPLEVRAAAADDVPLSTGYRRQNMYVAAHRYWREDFSEYFREFERIMLDHGGRPHWGKRYTLGHEDFSRMYPRFEEFRALRERLDPDAVFGNPLTDRIFGVQR